MVNTPKRPIFFRTVSIVLAILLISSLYKVATNLFAQIGEIGTITEQIPFDQEGWNAPMTNSEGHFTGTRLKMVDDLLDRYDFKGWSTQEIQNLLGEPDLRQEHSLQYDLREGLNLLIFTIDSQNTVLKYHVRKP